MARFKNTNEGPVRFTFANGKVPVRVKGGESFSTDDDEVKTAARKAGLKESSGKSSSSKESEK